MDLRELLNKIAADAAPLARQAALAVWNGSIGGNDADFEKSAALQRQLARYYSDKKLFHLLKDFKEKEEIRDPLLKRELEVVYNLFLAHQADPSLLDRIIIHSVELERIYGRYRTELDGQPVDDNRVGQILKTSLDSKTLEQVWKSHKAIGRQAEKELRETVKLRNEVALSLGFDNFHSMSLRLSGQDPSHVSAILEELDVLTRSSFMQAKKEMDDFLAERYGIPQKDLMPWHYQSPFFQEAPDLYPADPDKFYAGRNPEVITEKFYKSIGLDISPLLGKSSLYPRAGKNQHAFCTDIDTEGDIRVLCNIVPNRQWMETMLHEFGHAVYALGHDRSGLPYFLRNPAHTFMTEGVAMMFGRLPRNAAWMKSMLGLTEKEKREIEENCFKASRLQQIVFSRWAQVMYRFEKQMYADPRQDLNGLWRGLTEKYQQLASPPGRDEPDYASKIHIALYPCYYHNYLLGELFASQLHYYITDHITRSGNYRDECYTGRPEVGQWLEKKIFAPGMKYGWDELIEKATGEKLTPRYYAAQFLYGSL